MRGGGGERNAQRFDAVFDDNRRDAIAQHVRPGAVLGLATGSSPLPVYDALLRRRDAGLLSFTGVRAFTLDEYLGLPRSHPQSYHSVIRRDFTDRAGIEARLTAADSFVHTQDLPETDLLLAADYAAHEAGIAAALFDNRGAVAGAIGLAGPVERLLPDGPAADAVAAVKEAARGLSRELGAGRSALPGA